MQVERRNVIVFGCCAELKDMGHKLVCLECYRVENLGSDLTNLKIGDCPECNNDMTLLNHRFRPPKKTDKKNWDLVRFLVSEGFPFQQIIQEGKSDSYVEWPKTIKEAQEFVIKYKDQRISNKQCKT
ncbi:hypothetical protein CA2015_0774 [Cyclobacterium amurskyense]|uniref:Uncharacterized protein n=1 Tax=Cyclobacterium amurskyense TaxID=320787 RepID=A0A0H4PBP9_9BACT|nr:hypothetical protein CA2015_0774 [Cyclobacterium amurskyense]